MIKNLIFDFGKVLVDYDFMSIINRFFENKEDEQEYCQLVLSEEFMNQCDKEEVPFEELIKEKQRNHPKYARELQLFYDSYSDFVTGEVAGMKLLLTELKQMGFRLYGLTNWCNKVHEVMPRYEIFGLLDGWVISSEEHLIKPDMAIYRRLCEKYALNPSECFFADDKPINIEGAKKAGMKAVVFTHAAQYVEQLNEEVKGLDELRKSKDVPAHTVVGGVPVRVIKDLTGN